MANLIVWDGALLRDLDIDVLSPSEAVVKFQGRPPMKVRAKGSVASQFAISRIAVRYALQELDKPRTSPGHTISRDYQGDLEESFDSAGGIETATAVLEFLIRVMMERGLVLVSDAAIAGSVEGTEQEISTALTVLTTGTAGCVYASSGTYRVLDVAVALNLHRRLKFFK